MNRAFTKKNKIDLDPNWHLTSDRGNGIVLTFHEIRERRKLEKGSGKQVETGEIEKYLFEEKFYFPCIVQALKKYVEETQNKCKTLKEILEKQSYIMALLDKMDKEFKQFG